MKGFNDVPLELKTVDLAIAELDNDIKICWRIPKLGVVDHWSNIAEISPYDKVEFIGGRSGQVKAEIGPLCLWHIIEIDGKSHCFGNLFEITHRRPWYLNVDLAKKGDSGAWILNSTNGVVAWDGMLIGGDGGHAFCCFAENITLECQNSNLDNMILFQ